jgi:hypothetical protein
VASRLDLFQDELDRAEKPFEFSDCSIGNLVFAGSFLWTSRVFNRAIDDYCALLGLPPGLVENVTDGTNAFLVALDVDGQVLGSEGEIVDATRRNRIKDIFLLNRPLTDGERRRLAETPTEDAAKFLREHSAAVSLNPRLAARIREAELIIYSPGTQHSSLFPSYLTPGLSTAIASNLSAIKLLITNIQPDAEITGSSAVDIIERAVYYMKERDRRQTPIPCLITHYLINDPGHLEASAPYVPLGRLETLEDPRLVRVGNYEEGVTGRHDASKILTPFVESLLSQPQPPKVAAFLYGTESQNKIVQSLLEMIRGGIEELPVLVTVFYVGDALDRSFLELLPFDVKTLQAGRAEGPTSKDLLRIAAEERFDYVALFESSGMYRGEDLVNLLSYVTAGRLDAVWGSRRLSVRDIQHSYRLRYRRNVVLGAISYLGSHLLSVAHLLVYGRYVADTLSGARVIKTRYLLAANIDPVHKLANQHLLSALLFDRADLLETPVQFFSLSPERVRRTTLVDGLWSLATIVWWRIASPRRKLTRSSSGEAGRATARAVPFTDSPDHTRSDAPVAPR